MSQRICSVPDCSAKHDARGYCRTHYSRWRKGLPVVLACITCGADVRTVNGAANYCRPECRPECSEDGCSRQSRTRGLCAAHYDDLYKLELTGKPRAYRWATEKRCVVCGATEWRGKGRKVCSGRCKRLLARNGGQPPPAIAECVRCGSVIDLTVRGKAGRKKRADTKMCAWCKARHGTRHRVSVMDVVAARGAEPCQICGEEVDLALRHPDLFRASIDHIVPYSRGGTHDLSNLQVVHLYCNYLKSDREGFTI